jgi:hypothetical protein
VAAAAFLVMVVYNDRSRSIDHSRSDMAACYDDKPANPVLCGDLL